MQDYMQAALARMASRRAFPLVKVKETEAYGTVFEFYEEGTDRMVYDPHVRDPGDALFWIRQIVNKSWCTPDHIEAFCNLAMAEFWVSGR